MGMFDSIKFCCPNCGDVIIAQSKSGECMLNVYTNNNVPYDVAIDANRHAPFKCKCGKQWFLSRALYSTISLYPVEIKENKDE
jgi:hypothetical protein